MKPFTAMAPTVKWYHVIWATHRRRRVFKIPALRRFCEQVIQVNCVHSDWSVERACLSSDRVRLLVRASAQLPRSALVQELKRSTARIVREAGAVESAARVWDGGSWCSSVSSAPGVEAVRRHLERTSTLGTYGDGRGEVREG